MIELFFAFLCAMLIGYLVLLLRSFEYMSEQELKRQARNGNKKAEKVYAVRGAFGTHIFSLIWGLIGILTAIMIILLESGLWSAVAVAIAVPITIVVHAVLPWSKYPEPSLSMAAFVSPMFVQILRIITPILQPFEKLLGRWVSRTEIQHIHSKEELLEIISTAEITGDRVGRDELDIALHAMTFGEHSVGSVMIPRSVVKMVKSDEVLSPVVLGELHDSGFSRFPVQDNTSGDIIGTLFLKDAIEHKQSMLVSKVMRPEVYFVNEYASLDHVLNAFLKTKHHLFMVVNEFEEVTGIVTIEDILEQVLGKSIVDEFDRYDDLRAVAEKHAALEARKRKTQRV